MAGTKKAVRLAKVAREINVGIDTITAHLLKKGFEVESKPTTKLTPEMYDILITDFKSSIALKEKASLISLRNKRERETKKVNERGAKSDTSSLTSKRNRKKDTTSRKEPDVEKTTIAPIQPIATELPSAEIKPEAIDKVVSPIVVEPKEKTSQDKITLPIPPVVEETKVIEENKEKPLNSEKEVMPISVPIPTDTEKAIEDNIILDDKPKDKEPIREEKKIEPVVEVKEVAPPQISETTVVPDIVTKETEEQQLSEKPSLAEEKKDVLVQNTEEKQVAKPVLEKEIKTLSPKSDLEDDSSGKSTNKINTPEENNIVQEKVEKEEIVTNNKEEKVIVKEEKQANVASPPEIELAGPKVIGKIDLSGTNWKTRPDKKRKRKERKRRVRPGSEGDKKTGNQQDNVKQDGDERQIKERPKVQLKGPKVIGKIDLSAKQDKKEGEESTEGGLRPKRRRRKRIIKSTDKKVAIKKSDQSGTKTRTPNEKTLRVKKRIKKKSNTGRRNIEATEVSAKEIQDKIKATMAKLSGTSKGKSNRAKLRKQKREQAAIKRELVEDVETNVLSVTEFISVNEFAKLMDVAVNKVITTCFNLGIIVSINQRLDAEVIELVADEFGFEAEFINVTEQDEEEDYFNDAEEDLEPRAPVVTVMGHVDHGKTSLLDYIRNANVIAGEMGGITQHIGAYEVTTESGREITFLDTPGHEAFTAMRARGAKVTDIAVIVIAADDDIMPQTKEAISHAQAANVPMIFAINKVDKPTALPEKIKEQLAAMNLLVEDWGGQYQSQEISAKFGTNVDELLEKILLEAELLELKANPNREAVGTVLEASLDKGRGYVSNILVQNGSLKVGDMVLAGQHVGKVKAMFNERGKRVKTKVGPASPVTILGLNGAPQAGDRVKVMKSEQEAKSIATKRAQIIREQGFRASKHITLEEIGRRLKIGTFKELNLIVKGDMDGSVEALTDSLLKLSTEEIRVNVIHRGVGAITESDVLLASASDAIIVGFQVRPTINARRNAEQESIEIRTYSIIYDAIEEIKSAMEGMLEPKVEERFVCNIEVREAFKISKVGTVAGCYVAVGKVTKATKIHLLRDGIVVFTGEIETLKRFKDDVKEALPGQECGIRIKNYNDIKAGDVIEGFEEIEIKRTL